MDNWEQGYQETYQRMAAKPEAWMVTAAAFSRGAAMGTSMVVSGNRVGLKKL